ncbi:MAG: hypothetical protein AB2L20_14795 [Mangrovibacterium sp.]
MTPEINTYIEKHYRRWLDYSEYHCSIAGMTGEAIDVLDEVILALLQKDEQKVIRMMTSRKGKYTELDFYVLRMIKLNVHSATSPYQSRYRSIPTNDNVELCRLNIEDLQQEDIDVPSVVMEKFELVREVLGSLNLSGQAKGIFEYKFFQDQAFSHWPGPENRKQLYETYWQVVELIRAKIGGKTLL